MNVLSLFDGISCCRLALERAGHTVNKYYAAEIDKYAIKVAQKNYPDTVQLGSVDGWRGWSIDWHSIDLVTGGFPCQAWSVAGQQMGDRDPRGALFWTMLDIMRHVLKCNPAAKFLIENVKMKKDFEQYITAHTEAALGACNKHLINSALVSAQRRERYYWTNIKSIKQPEDKGILLKDIIEGFEIEGFEHTQKAIEYMSRTGSTGRVKWSYKFHSEVKNGKSQCVTANFFKGVPNNVLVIQRRRGKNAGGIRAKNGKTPTISSSSWEHNNHLCFANEIIRKFTPVECERLQTLPDNWTEGVSNTQRYKMIGNAWTVDVIAHIFRFVERKHD